jgi:hypothetical protein
LNWVIGHGSCLWLPMSKGNFLPCFFFPPALFLYERRSFEDGSSMVGGSRPNKLLPFCQHFGPFLPGYKSAPIPQKRSDFTLGYKICSSFSLPLHLKKDAYIIFQFSISPVVINFLGGFSL